MSEEELAILVVEDDDGDALLLKSAIQRFGVNRFKLARHQRVETALESLASNSFSLILSDLNLPDSSGFETFEALRAAAPECPIVVLSGEEDEELALRLVQAGAQDCLTKGDLGSHALVRCLTHAVERHRQQVELEEAGARARAASRAKTLFLANISHEIRTPMNSILGMADLLLETDLRDDQIRYVEVFRRSGEALLEIVNGLLDLSKVETGKLVLETTPFPLWELVERVGELLAFPAHRKGLSFGIDIRRDVPTWLVGDAGRVRQILINLVGNAIKFTGTGEIVLSASLATDEVSGEPRLCLSVRDTGAGVPPDRLEMIFEEFVQADESTTREFGGTGLGLALARRLAEAMDGTLTVESELGRGSIFTLSVPYVTAEAPDELGVEHRSAELTGQKVLVAERSETERALLRGYLERVGCDVTECCSSEEVLDAVERLENAGTQFDALLIACRLPAKGALDLIRDFEVMAKYASRTVALMPADRRPGDIELVGQSCPGGMIERPVKPSHLMRSLRSILLGEDIAQGSQSPYPQVDTPIRILVADDSVDNRSLIQAYANGSPIELVFAENGREAYERFQQELVDLVLMDVQMPVMNGHEATSAIRRWEQDTGHEPTPILALTAYAFAQDRTRSAEAGCDGHLVKPLRKAQLFQAIADYTQKSPIEVRIDPDLEDLIPGYLESRLADVETLRAQDGEPDFDTLRRIGHNMKGTGRGYGFDEISDLGAAIEHSADAERHEDMLGLADRLESFIDRVRLVPGKVDSKETGAA